MGGFFRTDFSGAMGTFSGAAAVVNGKVAALDVGGGQLYGTYSESGNRLIGTLAVGVPGGGVLASGAHVSGHGTVQVPFDLPADALDGHEFTLNVGGGQVHVKLTKIADL